MIPRAEQLIAAKEGYDILREYMIVYLAMEERTGKSLSAVLIAEFCHNVDSIAVITKRKAIPDWEKLIREYTTDLAIQLTTFGLAAKTITKDVDLVIIDEAHNYISSYPKPPRLMLQFRKLFKGLPIIYLSATPHAQGRQMLFHQFAISSWSPWKDYKNFYAWFKDYGISETAYIHDREVETYSVYKDEKLIADTKHLFYGKTRRELGFVHEPIDKVHYIELEENTKAAYNELMKHKLIEVDRQNPKMLVCDTPMKLRASLHMIEGGSLKINNEYIELANNEKIDYIKEVFGDVESLVIFYQYKAEKIKLEKHFKHANILQGTSNAEGVDLTEYDTIVIYSQDWSTAKHTQRRARQASKHRDKEIIVHFLLVKNGVSEQCYEQVSVNKVNFVDSVFKRVEL